jgi:hypothetical protein
MAWEELSIQSEGCLEEILYQTSGGVVRTWCCSLSSARHFKGTMSAQCWDCLACCTSCFLERLPRKMIFPDHVEVVFTAAGTAVQ